MGMRNNMIQTLRDDYTRLALAKGLKPWKVALLYSARNAILPNVTGFAITLSGDLPWHVTLFSESASRAVVSVASQNGDALENLARRHHVPFARLGETGGPRMVFDSLFETTVAEARAAYEDAIPSLLASAAATA